MPRKTEHETCVECGKKARVCLNFQYWVLGGKLPGKRGQVTESLHATEGFCIRCFLKKLRELKVNRTEVGELKRLLERVQFNEPDHESPRQVRGKWIKSGHK